MESIVELIAKKRDGHALSPAQIERLIHAFMAGELAEYQMSAFCMAVFFRGMDDHETTALTHAMLHSGDVVDLNDISGSKVDKHSTGGVGDKVSICLAPLVASCGVRVPMVSGRGLGHSGGTLDKLEAIPGFQVQLDIDAFRRIVRDVGTCMIGQTSRIAPADKRIYGLRDVTATVESIPLIVASILSKKLAEGIDGLVLDVKTGRGAFMKTEADARRLAKTLVRVGTLAGKKVTAFLTDMNAPLGLTIGNALETREAIEILHNNGPSDLRECTLALGAEMLLIGGAASSTEDARQMLQKSLQDGRALEVFERMVHAQGGDAKVARHPERLPQAPHQIPLTAEQSGYVHSIDPLELGLSAVAMGAGRTRADQHILPDVGIEIMAPKGTRVSPGHPIAVLHVREPEDAGALKDRIQNAFTLSPEPPTPTPLVIARLDAQNA